MNFLTDKLLVDKFVVEGITRLTLHDVALGLFVGQGDGGDHVSSQIDTQNCDGTQWEGHISQDEEQEGTDLGNVTGQCVGDGFLQVVEDQTTLLNTSDDGGKVVVQQDHVSGLFAHIRASNTHSHTCNTNRENSQNFITQLK